MRNSFLTALLAELTKNFGNGETVGFAVSLAGIQDVRDCVVRLVGPYSENVFWEVAIRSCMAPDYICTSMSQQNFMLVQLSTSPPTIEKPLLVAFEDANTAYLTVLSRLIGQGMIEHQLRNCIGI